MTSPIRIAALLLAFATSSHAESPAPERAAQLAAESWLSLVDAGKSIESWDALAAPARQSIARWKWRLAFSIAQRQYGAFSSRHLRSTRLATKSPSGRSGEFAYIEFDAISSKKGPVVEKLWAIHEPDGQWRVVTYAADAPTKT